jgi:hypothetical protein
MQNELMCEDISLYEDFMKLKKYLTTSSSVNMTGMLLELINKV